MKHQVEPDAVNSLQALFNPVVIVESDWERRDLVSSSSLISHTLRSGNAMAESHKPATKSLHEFRIIHVKRSKYALWKKIKCDALPFIV